MVFSDLFFLFVFLPAFIICYQIGAWLDRRMSDDRNHPLFTVRNGVMVVFSLVFYAWGEPIYVFLMIGAVFINYLSGLWIAAAKRRWRRLALIVGLALNIAMLGVFKYAGFIASNLHFFGIEADIPEIALPIGISFYTFQSISYLIDVYRCAADVQRKYSDLLLYISMFPQLIAGPIVRYDTVARELSDRSVTPTDVSDGVFRFLLGLGKKVILANQFGEIAGGFLASSNLGDVSVCGAWIGILAFTFQIYFDFSGYSDMAIGIGRCLGFHFNENFDHPYCSRSITEFWRRWHMSLGSFFRDYVYIPLGGNRHHQVINILLVWFLTGMWHGASWNFILWGLYFAVILMIEKKYILPRINALPRFMFHCYAMLLVVLGWGIFYFTDINEMGRFFHALVGGTGIFWQFADENALRTHFWLWIAAVVFSMPVRSMVSRIPGMVMGHGSSVAATTEIISRTIVSVVMLIVSVALLIGATNNAFLYTRF